VAIPRSLMTPQQSPSKDDDLLRSSLIYSFQTFKNIATAQFAWLDVGFVYDILMPNSYYLFNL
jgi:hypothetical protein